MGRISLKALLKNCLLVVVGGLMGLWISTAILESKNVEQLCRKKRGVLPYRPVSTNSTTVVNSTSSSRENTTKSTLSYSVNGEERWYNDSAKLTSVYSSIDLERERSESAMNPDSEMKPREKDVLFIGVSTTQSRLKSRVTAVNRTWGNHISNSLSFFVLDDELQVSDTNLQPSVFSLERKAKNQLRIFQTLQYMCANKIHDFNWFMWTKDNVYVQVDNVVPFLNTIDADKDLYIGRPVSKLKVDGEVEYYCDGNAGVIFSRSLLLKMGPFLESCLQNSTTLNGGLEVGRCISQHVGVPCSQMPVLLHKPQTNIPPNQNELYANDDLTKALTIYPIADTQAMYMLHLHYIKWAAKKSIDRTLGIFQEMVQLQNEILTGTYS